METLGDAQGRAYTVTEQGATAITVTDAVDSTDNAADEPTDGSGVEADAGNDSPTNSDDGWRR